MRVFFDTNVLVSAFTARGLSADVFRLALLEHEILTGEFNLRELERVLARRLRAPADAVCNSLDLLREQTVVPLPSAPRAAPGPDRSLPASESGANLQGCGRAARGRDRSLPASECCRGL